MIKGFHHFAVSTGDLRRLVHFYCEILGFDFIRDLEWQAGTERGAACDRVVGLRDSAAKAAMVGKGGVILEIFEYSAPTSKAIPSDWKVSDHGYTHLCLEVDDLDAEYARLLTAGMTFNSEPAASSTGGIRAVYGRDPEGHVIELLELSLDAMS